MEKNPTGNLNDAFKRVETGSQVDLGGWKSTGILILVVIIGFLIWSIFLK